MVCACHRFTLKWAKKKKHALPGNGPRMFKVKAREIVKVTHLGIKSCVSMDNMVVVYSLSTRLDAEATGTREFEELKVKIS